MGSYDAALLGVADNVDAYNSRLEQSAIVFVDTFEVFGVLNPSVDEMADALANVTSHEIGHLLGLQHTRDPLGIMDITASLRQMLAPQTFRASALHPETFRVGFQNGPRSLLEAVGASGESSAKSGADLPVRDPWYDEGSSIPARLYGAFGSGCLKCRMEAKGVAGPGMAVIGHGG
jgi:hypothetical protein